MTGHVDTEKIADTCRPGAGGIDHDVGLDLAVGGLEPPAADGPRRGQHAHARPDPGASCLSEPGEDPAVRRPVDPPVAWPEQPAGHAPTAQPGHEAAHTVGVEHLRVVDAE